MPMPPGWHLGSPYLCCFVFIIQNFGSQISEYIRIAIYLDIYLNSGGPILRGDLGARVESVFHF